MSVCLDVRLGCTNFPKGGTTSGHGNGVELLEIDGNTTLSGGSGQSVSNISSGTNVENPNAVVLAPWPS